MPRAKQLKPDKWDACIQRIQAKGKIGKADALKLLQEVSDRAEAMRQTGTADPFVAAAKATAAQIKEGARADLRDAVVNAGIRKTVLQLVKDGGGIKRAASVLRGLLHGTNIAGRDSVQSRWWGNASIWQGVLRSQMRKDGTYKVAISGAEDKNTARELLDLNRGIQKAAGNSPARRLAEAIWPLLDSIRDRLNGAGARIGDATDYIAHTSHDPDKMLAAAGPNKTPAQAFEAWWSATEPRLAPKTFDGVVPGKGETMNDAKRRFGRSVFDALTTGIHMSPDGAFGLKDEKTFVPPAFEGTRNIARKLSQPRVLFFKDADAWTAHMQQFSKGRTLLENVMRTIDVSARNLALMEKFGTNPGANLNQIIRQIQETYRGDITEIGKFQRKIDGIQAVMGHLDGTANRPANEMWAKLGASTRTFETMAYLGSVGITHFASIWPTVISEGVHHGIPRMQMLGNLVSALVRGKVGEERAEILAQLGSYAHGLTRDMYARWQPEDTVPGRLSSLANTFMELTGLPYIFDNAQSAMRETLANQLARYTGKTMDQFDPHLSQMLKKYGIGEDEWNLLRRVPNLSKAEGMEYMTPRDATRMDAGQVEALLRRRGKIGAKATPETIAAMVKDFQNDVADRLRGYYADAAAHSTVTAGVRERALIYGLAQPGTFAGELTRFVAQFKMWPLAAMHQLIGREIWMSLSGKEMAWNLGIMAALSTTGGYLRMAINDVATGRPVRNPTDPNVLAAALAQGGGVGILGDFMFGEVNRFEGGLVGTLGGPLISDADQVVKIYGQWRSGNAGWPDLAHFAVRHVPFANLVWFKGMFDYLAWYHLYEAASPGWWERTNRRLIKDQGRAMAGYKPGRGVPWTPWGLDLEQLTGGGGDVGQPTIQ